MDIYLTEIELLREENIFTAHEVVYVFAEEEKKWDIRTYTPKAVGENMLSIPSS